MLIENSRETLAGIKNSDLAKYAGMDTRIYKDFMQQIQGSGIAVAREDYREETRQRIEGLRQQGAVVRNDAKSLYINGISPACLACQKGVGSMTFSSPSSATVTAFSVLTPTRKATRLLLGAAPVLIFSQALAVLGGIVFTFLALRAYGEKGSLLTGQWLYGALALLVLAELASRYLFYATGVSITIGQF
ncbi:hypothetical protein MTAT_07520 [Moorella thermoacetica]|uniref:Uncharacterized protein n=1 Tax=Neomoorella thermoacetica TaxID=1525 RepID=A0AAC9HHU1_NEOTH|nr:hypothetical protein [Moorella thermoacetica]AOQ24113.1 hypothetical protein Maut_01674 [Moorella thermoacetica]TYL14517.1 hypothetical protein MTAT_07520 [Moorella thermoacetica]